MIIYKPITRKHKIEEIQQLYERKLGIKLNLDSPRTFNEKLHWLKLNYKDPRMYTRADKITAKKEVAEEIGEEYIIPTIGVYDSAYDIDWESLPERFVIKISDGYSQNIVCTDKKKFDTQDAIERLTDWLKPTSRVYWRSGSYQSQYRATRPRILIEQYIGDKDNQIYEYKFMYLSGKLAFIMVTTERSLKKASDVKITHFDANWKKLDLKRQDHLVSEKKIPQPKLLAEMLKLSSELAQGFPVCRVDFYEVGEAIKMGELTFTPSDGFSLYSPDEWNVRLGDMIKLPKRNDFIFLEWKPIEVNPRTLFEKISPKHLLKKVLPNGAVAQYRERRSNRKASLEQSINVKFIGHLSDADVLEVMRKEGSYIHFGQSAEDGILNRIFRGKRNGFYVDVGAFHPTKFSNTFLFHRFLDWRGINIDASKQSIELFEESRPNDINLNVAIGEKEGIQELTIYSDPARNTFSNENKSRQLKKGGADVVKTEKIATYPLKKVLDEHLPEGTHIDILDIDIEGYDLQALATNDWKKYRPSVILIEDYAINTAGPDASEVYDFMKKLNYRFLSHAFDTSIYIDNQQDFDV